MRRYWDRRCKNQRDGKERRLQPAAPREEKRGAGRGDKVGSTGRRLREEMTKSLVVDQAIAAGPYEEPKTGPIAISSKKIFGRGKSRLEIKAKRKKGGARRLEGLGGAGGRREVQKGDRVDASQAGGTARWWAQRSKKKIVGVNWTREGVDRGQPLHEAITKTK